MVDRIIKDINKALEAEAYIAALSLTLILPDICAKAECGDSMTNKGRYIKWYDEYIGQYEKKPTKPGEIEMPYLSGEVVYQLRCSMLHQGTPNVDDSKIKDNNCKINHFVLAIEKKKPYDIYVDASCVLKSQLQSENEPIRSYRVNVRRLCLIITDTVSEYFKENKDKFNFFNYEILDLDETCRQMNKLHERPRDE